MYRRDAAHAARNADVGTRDSVARREHAQWVRVNAWAATISVAPALNGKGGKSQACGERERSATGAAEATSAALQRART